MKIYDVVDDDGSESDDDSDDYDYDNVEYDVILFFHLHLLILIVLHSITYLYLLSCRYLLSIYSVCYRSHHSIYLSICIPPTYPSTH